MAKLTIYNPDENKFTKVEEPDPSAYYTYADYVKWQFEEQMELIKGKIFKMSPAPAPVHQRISMALGSQLYHKLKKSNCQVYAAPFDVRLPVGGKTKDEEITTVVQPDLCIICDESKIDGRGCLGPPDLIVEILSPGNTKKDLEIKHGVYREAGVQEYWVVYPKEEQISVFILNENTKYNYAVTYTDNAKIKCTSVQGLTINLKEVFSKK